ncbi:AraC family transcriptional regulator [Geodermatophilus sp. CPCC 206100]
MGSRVYHPHRVTVLGDAARFAMSLEAASFGPLTVGWLTYDTEVRIEGFHQGHYQVNVPTTASMVARCGPREATVSPGTATVYRPDRAAAFTSWSSPAPVLALRIPQPTLDQALEQLLDRPLRASVDFELAMDVSTGRGEQWLALVRALAHCIADRDSLLRQPSVAAPYVHSILTGLLYAAGHDHLDELAAPAAGVGATTVRRARAFIEEHAADPITVVDVARAAGVGVRGLQHGFSRALGMSPTEYLRQVRLRHVHRELLGADPARTTVAQIAARWGFLHHGRFAAQYRERHGASPGETLRRRT